MAAFDPESDLDEDRAYQLLRFSPVTLFWRPQVLDETTEWLNDRGYQVIRLDASGWSTENDLYRDIAAALGFPGCRSLSDLDDYMEDVVSPNSTGLVLVFTGYDAFAARCPRAAQIVLHIMADHSRLAALLGERLMCLVQSNDPQIRFEPVGASPPAWNRAEWLDSRRRQ
jgi:hypothetical protein